MKTSTPLVSALTSTLLAPIALGIAISSVVMLQPATAQPTGTVDPLGDINSRQSERDSLTGRTGDDGFSFFDLIHRSQLGTSEFDEETVQKNLDTATEEFRRQQLERLGNSQPAIPGTPSTTPGMAN